MAAVARAEPTPGEGPPDDNSTTAPPAKSGSVNEASPMNPAAKSRYEKGLELYGQRNFRAAVAEFEAGFAVEPRREFLFAEAQAYRLAGDCHHAVPLFDRFLATGPSAIQIDATRLALDRCAHQAPPTVVAPPVRVLPAPLPPAPPPPRPAWWRDPWGAAALGTGVVALAVGAGFAVAASHAWDQAHAPRTRLAPDFDRLSADYERDYKIGVVSLAAGAAFCAAGATRLAIVRHRERVEEERPHASLSVDPLPRGAALSWRGSF